MCGIFFTSRADLWKGQEDSLLELLRHRGPDGFGVWRDEARNLLAAQTRLEILGLGEPGRQPSVLGSSVLLFNGEIYNFRELITENKLRPSPSDTHVLHQILEASGDIRRLRGMYAFVHFDVSQGLLTVARDQFGIKPLYLKRHLTGGISLASEISVLNLSSDASAIDEEGLRRYLFTGHTGPTTTTRTGIVKVAAGTRSTFVLGESGTVTSSATERIITPVGEPATLADALEGSIRRHLVADVPVGVFLSGGLDSVLLAALARDHTPGLQTFTVTFPGSPHDESSYARRHASLLGSRHHEVVATPSRMYEAACRFVRHHGEPLGDPAVMPLLLLAEGAAQHVKVALGGEGADELFGGYQRYKFWHAVQRFPGTASTGVGPANRAFPLVSGDSPPHRILNSLLLRDPFLAHLVMLGTEPSLLSARNFQATIHELKSLWIHDPSRLSLYERALQFDSNVLLRESYLEKTDRATMAAGLEARVPYLDVDVMAVAKRSHHPPGKGALRKLLAVKLPDTELPTKKLGLTVQLEGVLRAGLQNDLSFALESQASFLRRVLSPDELKTLRAGANGSYFTRFRIAMLGLWQQQGVQLT